MNNVPKPLPAQLPESREAFLAKRKIKAVRTLNDQIEDVHLELANDKEYKRFLYAVYDEQAVEGSLSADNVKAAEMLRNKATEVNPDGEVAAQKLATIIKALGVVLRRYEEDRKTRRNTVGGEVVPDINE